MTVPLLALSLGVATAIFALVNAVVHPAIAFQDVDQLYTVGTRGDGANRRVTAYERIAALRQRSARTADVALSEFERVVVESSRSVEQLSVGRVSANYFTMLGVHPMRGRLFSTTTVDTDADRGAVISFTLWRRLFGSPRSLAGLTITADMKSYNVIGVAPLGLGTVDQSDLWLVVPASAITLGNGLTWPSAVVRARDGTSLSALQEDLRRVAAQLSAQFGTGRQPFSFDVRPLRPDPLELSEIHFALIAAAVALVLIGCANLANLVLARGLGKQRDVALRLAVGATRRDVVLDTLAECLLIALAGAALGLLFAVWALAIVQRVIPPDVPIVGDLSANSDWRVYAFTGLAAIVTSLLFGVGPALRIAMVDVST
ncbi:MAG: ABC transporter permease, partial [Gemmatimonadaceae bacterium]